jgi:hypothetical protein
VIPEHTLKAPHAPHVQDAVQLRVRLCVPVLHGPQAWVSLEDWPGMHSAVWTEHALHADQVPHPHPPGAQVRLRVWMPLAHGPQACISEAIWPSAQTETPVSHLARSASAPSSDLGESPRSESVCDGSIVTSSLESVVPASMADVPGSMGEASGLVASAPERCSAVVAASKSTAGSSVDPSLSSSRPSSLPRTTLQAGVIPNRSAQTPFILREYWNKGCSSTGLQVHAARQMGPLCDGTAKDLLFGLRIGPERPTKWAERNPRLAPLGCGRTARRRPSIVAAPWPSWHENRAF